MTPSIDLHVSWHTSPAGAHYVKATVYGTNQGRYGSEVTVIYQVGEEAPPRDREELVAILLTGLSQAVYHS